MTKYILHGGETGVDNKHNKAFYQEWVRGFTDDFKPIILLVYFSRPSKEWGKLEKQDRERFTKYTNHRAVDFIVSDKNLEVFQEQIKKADVIYVRGGGVKRLIDAFFPLRDKLLGLLKDKVYVGSSAGVMLLSHHTRSHKSKWKQGLGLLPINTVVHWSKELEESLNSFKEKYPEDSKEYLLIPETEFVVREY